MLKETTLAVCGSGATFYDRIYTIYQSIKPFLEKKKKKKKKKKDYFEEYGAFNATLYKCVVAVKLSILELSAVYNYFSGLSGSTKIHTISLNQG